MSLSKERAREGAGRRILTPTCSWILLLKYFWMSLRLVLEQRARWLSSVCREDEGGRSDTRTGLQPGDAAPRLSHPKKIPPPPQHPYQEGCAVERLQGQPTALGVEAQLQALGRRTLLAGTQATPQGTPPLPLVPSGHSAASCSAGSRTSAAPRLPSARPRCGAKGEQGGCGVEGEGL